MKFLRAFCYNFIDVDIFLSPYHILGHLKISHPIFIIKKYDGERPKLSNFKIEEKIKNRGTKIAIKPDYKMKNQSICSNALSFTKTQFQLKKKKKQKPNT